MILKLIKSPIIRARKASREIMNSRDIKRRLSNRSEENINSRLVLENVSQEVLRFLDSRKCPVSEFQFFYSESTTEPTLYASSYACMTLSLLDKFVDYDLLVKKQWAQYLNSFQNKSDGIFYDPVIQSDLFLEADWWGRRHLTTHMISTLTSLGYKTKYPLGFLENYYTKTGIKNWLDQFNWDGKEIGFSDVDNAIMNVGCLLQYQRDAWASREAGEALKYLKCYLRSKINIEHGMWGIFDVKKPTQRSRLVQFAYHLFLIFFYDKEYDFDVNKIIDIVLKTQNEFGGYGVMSNSSACEDIDSVDLLIRLYPYASEKNKEKIDQSLLKAFNWVLLNQVPDGGFVFRLNEPFVYGHRQTSSLKNEGAMLPTWFRVLCIVYIAKHFKYDAGFNITPCPGYEF